VCVGGVGRKGGFAARSVVGVEAHGINMLSIIFCITILMKMPSMADI
jgi:hypothetical protein